ncbi:MAG TPA: hypothetical protein VN325_06275 [Steroidobacteraceae bacterium]|nr:hypothetical protein [Steroidobacteraceae bacterium]
MPRTVGVGFLFVVALTACGHFKGSPSPAAEAPARSAPDVQLSSDGQTAVAAPDTLPATPPAEPPPAAGSPAAGLPATGGPTAASPPPSPAPATAKPAQPQTAGNGNPRGPRGPGSPAGGSSKPLAAEQHGAPAAAQAAAAQPVAKPPASPPLDLAGLEQRLKDTHAIGLFTKLSLKNQVDDLLGAFRAFHGGQTQPPLADLRQRYDLLLLKVLTLLQDGDPPLASAISASREAIWALLADRDKFQKIQMG